MMTMEQIALADADRATYLNEQARLSRERKRSRKWVGFPRGATKAELPANWNEIDDAILRHIKHKHMKEIRAITSCVADLLGIACAAVGRAMKVGTHRVSLDVARQHRPVNAWMKVESKRIAAKCPRPVYEERKVA